MRAFRQAVEAAGPRLGDAAAGAKQVPAQFQEARAHRLQAELDRLDRPALPFPGKLQRPHMPEIDFLRFQDMVGEPSCQAMPVGRIPRSPPPCARPVSRSPARAPALHM